ncbi:MAG: hypothetical protein AAGD38_18855 [Acidobacteriota bacterium]
MIALDDPREHFLQTTRRADVLGDYMEVVEDYLLDDPGKARYWAELLPCKLSEEDAVEIRARALTLLGATRSATADFPGAALAFEAAFTLTPSARDFPYRAWQHAVRARFWTHQRDRERAAADVDTGFRLLGDARSRAARTVRALLYLSEHRFALDRKDWSTAATKAEEAFREAEGRKRKGIYPFGERVRTAAAICYLSSIAAIDPARALWEMQNRNLIPQRMKRRGYDEPTRSTLILSWTAGYLQAKLGHEKPALDNLAWAATHLAELGATLDAARCAINLVVLASKDHPAACTAMRALRDHPDTSDHLRHIAIDWLATPDTADPVPALQAALDREAQRRREFVGKRATL